MLTTNSGFFARLQRREADVAWSLGSAIVFVGAYVIVVIAGQVIALTLTGDNPNFPARNTLAYGVVIGTLGLALVTFLWARRRFAGTWLTALRLNSTETSVTLFTYILIGLGSAWALDLVGGVLGLKGDDVVPKLVSALQGAIGLGWVTAVIGAVFLMPLIDTLFFQGILYPAFTREMKNNLVGIGLTALVFAIANLAIGAGSNVWYGLVQPFGMALILTGIRAYTGSLRPVLAARIMFGVFFVLSAIILKA
jgi:hypothetical protein